MAQWSWVGFLIVTLNHNVNIVGKIWFTSMILLRMAVIVLAGYPLYQDEQEKFVCNTLQPGCSNVCYDIFSPVSHFRFWLAQVLCVLLPHILFGVYVLSEAAAQHTASEISTSRMLPSPLTGSPAISKGDPWEIPDFSGAYIVHLVFRIIPEVGFSVGQYYLFGFFVPKTYSCVEPPCASYVACYSSRPTEKSFMMIVMWVISGGSLLLSIADLIYVIHKRARVGIERCKFVMMEGDFAKDGRCSAVKPQVIFPESPEGGKNHHHFQHHDLRKKRDDPTLDYSPSFRSDEDEAASLEFGMSTKDPARSNMNSNSNKNAYSLTVSFTPPGGSMNDLCKPGPPSIISNGQPRFGKTENEDPFFKSSENRRPDGQLYTKLLGKDSLEEIIPSVHSSFSTSAYIRSQKSQWV